MEKDNFNNAKYDFNIKIMIENQLKARGISDKKTLSAMEKVPRHLFVPKDSLNHSYYDGPLSIGHGQTISQPYIVAYMTELLELSGKERVLEIGTGSGYQTAILAEIVQQVYTMEILESLLKNAREILLDQMHYTNISFKNGSGRAGWEEFAPFDRIIITAAAEEIPRVLLNQLNEEGMMVAPVGRFMQRMKRFFKRDNQITDEALIGVSFVPFV